MKYTIIIFLLLFFVIFSQPGDDPLPPNIHCTDGLMKQAFCELGQDIPASSFNEFSEDFIIWVDSSNSATNFISFLEEIARGFANGWDTSNFTIFRTGAGWEKLSSEQKIERVEKEKLYEKNRVDSMHIYNNTDKQQIFIINNSKDTVAIQMQDEFFMCVLQAKANNGKWYPIQYWKFSGCGLSYYLKKFPPNTANSFVTKLPNEGDFETTLRYKLLGADKFFYSNEFPGRIDYCEFIADSSVLPKYPENNFLDSLIRYWDY